MPTRLDCAACLAGWRVIEIPPVKFIRPETMRPLPEPQLGGSIDDLWALANIPERSRILVISWLVECLRPETVFPLLELIGEQGSAKSSTQTALRRLVDPNAADLRAAPKSSEEIFIAACASWMVSYENLSHLGPQLQDSLCTVATGGGYAKRKLYSDTDESVISVKRPTILNGIAACVTAQDLVQRTISIELPVIKARLEEKEVSEKFDTLQPKLIGALLSIFSQALGYMAQVHIPPTERPRLADFAKLGVCIAMATGQPPEAFWREFNAASLESIERTIEGNPVASAIMEWHKDNPGAKKYSTKEIYEKLDAYKRNDAEAWPRSPKGLGDAMRRAAPSLRALGVECSCLGKQGGTIRWLIADRQKDTPKTSANQSLACGLQSKQSPESLQSPDDCSKHHQSSTAEQDIVDIKDFTSTPNIKQYSGEIIEVEI